MANKKKKRPTPPPPPVRSKPPRAATAPAGPTKRERERAQRQQVARREGLKSKLITAGLAAAVLAGVAGYVITDRRADAELRETLTAGSCEVDTQTDPTRAQGQNHVQSPSYRVNPPSGGDHLAGVARGGVYRGASVPADGLLVHALEHGYVVLWYRPDLPADEIEQLAEFERSHDGDVLVVERPALPVPVAATAWGHRLLCQSVEPEPLQRFFDERVGDGPEDVPRG